MAKVIRHLNDDQKEFVKIMDKLAYRFQRWEIWRDFIIMFAISLSNAVDKIHAEKREKLYMQTIGKYNKQEQELFPELCRIVVMALENDKDRDFLGELYMTLELSNHWTGQFFTPYNVCKMMAMMNCDNVVSEIKEKGFISVNDPTCGAGALLVAFANAAQDATNDSGYNWQNHILFTAQDVDMIVGLMCYIQLSLIGCAGYVKIGNSLTEPMTDNEALINLTSENSNYWYTPIYFSDVWHWRRIFHLLDKAIKLEIKHPQEEMSEEKTKVKTAIPETNPQDIDKNGYVTEKSGQISLF